MPALNENSYNVKLCAKNSGQSQFQISVVKKLSRTILKAI